MTSLALLLGSLTLAASAEAGWTSRVWCVGEGTGEPGVCGPSCWNDEPFPDLAAAASAMVMENGVNPGAVDEDVLCLLEPPTTFPSLSLDASTGNLNARVTIRAANGEDWGGCPTIPGTPSLPLWTIRGLGPSDSLTVVAHRMLLDGFGCEYGTVAAVDDGAIFHVESARWRQLQGPSVILGGGTWELNSTRLSQWTGPVVTGSGTWSLDNVEVSSSTSAAGPLVDLDGVIVIEKSALVGNVVSGGHALLDVRGGAVFRGSTIGENVVTDDGPLLRFRDGGPGYAGLHIHASIWSRNHLLGAASASASAPITPEYTSNLPGEVCLPQGSDRVPLDGRPVPAWTGPASSAPLIELTGTGGLATSHVNILKSFINANDQGEDARVFSAEEIGEGSRWVFIHNSFGPEVRPLLSEGLMAASESVLLLARNILPAQALFGIPHSWTSLEAVGNLFVGTDVVEPDPAWATMSVIGPNLTIPIEQFTELMLSPDDYSLLTACERAESVCPNVVANCTNSDIDHLSCPTFGAVALVPTPGFIAAWSPRYPWRGSYFNLKDSDGQPASTPGASGWTCDLQEVPWDRLDRPPTPIGDGDGFSNLTDCDNEDPAEFPVLPEHDGYRTETCDEAEGRCYRCPDGAPGPDEGDLTPSPQTSNGELPSLPDGCGNTGCGYAWTCDSGSLVALLWVPWFRRRRSALPRRTG